MKFCDQCGAHLNDNAKFCSACGAAVTSTLEIPKLPVCNKCGEPIEDGDSFCANCGEPCDTIESYEKQSRINIDETDTPSNGSIGMCILGIIVMVSGGALISYGSSLNNSLEAQLNSLLSSGATDPGTVWITFGALGAVLGLVLLIFSFRKN